MVCVGFYESGDRDRRDEVTAMFCSQCGQGLGMGQVRCPRCGRAAEAAAPFHGGNGGVASGWAQWAMLERRLRPLAVCWLVYAGLIAVVGLGGLAIAHVALGGGHWMALGGEPRFHPGFGGRHFSHSGELPFLVLRFAWLGVLLKAGLAAAAGVGLMGRARWARSVAIVAACFSLLSFPLGTALAVWTLVVLLNRENAWNYDRMAG